MRRLSTAAIALSLGLGACDSAGEVSSPAESEAKASSSPVAAGLPEIRYYSISDA